MIHVLTLTMRTALDPVPGVFDLTIAVVGGAQAVSAVPDVLTHIPLPSAEHLYTLPLPHPPDKVPGVQIPTGHTEHAPALLEALPEHPRVSVAVIVQRCSVTILKSQELSRSSLNPTALY